MTRNLKIALGCGGAGCLGLIVVVIAAGLIYFLSGNRTYSTNRNYNVNTTNRNSNLNSNDNDNSNTSTSPSTSTPASSLSDDDKHKLYQAATMTGDEQLLRRVSVKLGLMNEDYTPGDNYEQFIADHVSWAIRNLGFINSISTPEKERAYVDATFPD